MSHLNIDLNLIIAEEQKNAALEYQSEAWAGGISNGIEPEILAEAAFDTALRQLLKIRSEVQAFALLSQMKDKIAMGEFHDIKMIQ